MLAMSSLFLRPESTFFIYGVAIAMPVMIVVAYFLTGFKGLFRPSVASVGIGFLSALLLYIVFYAGNYAIKLYGAVVGIHQASEVSIYGTIGSHPLYLQIIILVLDALGFESYFRGTLQTFFAGRIPRGKLKFASAFLAAFCDAAIHVLSFNPLWVITTFIADSAWGMTFYFKKDLTSSVTSHLVWDILIFVIAPIT